jgi:hypothetical protein
VAELVAFGRSKLLLATGIHRTSESVSVSFFGVGEESVEQIGGEQFHAKTTRDPLHWDSSNLVFENLENEELI